MTTTVEPSTSFVYQAQGIDGQRLTGTIEAEDSQAAMNRLLALGLRVIQLDPARARDDSRPGR